MEDQVLTEWGAVLGDSQIGGKLRDARIIRKRASVDKGPMLMWVKLFEWGENNRVAFQVTDDLER